MGRDGKDKTGRDRRRIRKTEERVLGEGGNKGRKRGAIWWGRGRDRIV